MKALPDETRTQRTIRDLVALSTLPAIWVNYQPLQVAQSLAEVLQSTLGLDLVYLRLRGQADGGAIEVARTGRRPTEAGQAEEIGRALTPWLDRAHTNSAVSVPNPVGSGTVRIVRIPIGWEGEEWVLVAGSQHADFPTDEERLLLSVGANQAAMMFQRKQAEDALRESEERFRRYFELGLTGMAITSPAKGCLEVNDEICRILGYTREEMLQKTWAEMTHPDDLAADVDKFNRVLAGEIDGYTMDKRWIRKDGRAIDSSISVNCVRRDDGSVDYFVALLQDVTERKQAEAALRASEKSLAADLAGMARLQAVSTRLVHGSDPTPLLQEIVDAAIEITAADMGNIQLFDPESGTLRIVASRGLGLPFLEFFQTVHAGHGTCGGATHNGDRVVVEDITTSPMFAGTPLLDIYLASGIRAVQSTPLIGRSGQLVGMLSTDYRVPRRPADRDLSVLDTLARQAADWIERTQAEEALRASEGRFRGTFENAAVGIANTDRQGGFLRVNDKLCDIVEYTREELLERSFVEITHPNFLPANLELYARLWRSEIPSFTAEKRYIRKDGSVVWCEVTVSLQCDATGAPAYAIAVIEDVSDRKRLEAELRLAKEAAEAAIRAKDEFLANVSHEIRTPFGAILGMTELVLETPLNEDQRECLEIAKSAADSLLGIINDLLDFEKIEAGKLELDPSDFSLREVLLDTLQTLVLRAQAKGIELVCDIHSDAPDALVGDAGRLRQVLINLISNAIKFTIHGQVAVRVKVDDGPAPQGVALLCFMVSDTGIGIPPEGRERIFRAFEQAESTTTRRYGGTGLGLTIAARLVSLMGGTINVESEPGQGSTFFFTARFGQQPHPRERVVARPSDVIHEAAMSTRLAAPLRILAAEDGQLNSRHLERLLTRRGHTVRVATDGREALDLAIEGAFDLLLLDLHMPELDGFQVVRAVRLREHTTGGRLPVIALTARARKEDRESCLAAGMDDYLSKPVRAVELFAAIDRVVAPDRVSLPGVARLGDGASLIDPAALLAACDGDGEGLRAMCRDFQAYAPAWLAAASDALQTRDAQSLREAAHKLCGLLLAFSTAAGGVASDLEDQAAHGQLDEARPLVVRLESMVQELIPEVDNVSCEAFRDRAGAADDPSRTTGA